MTKRPTPGLWGLAVALTLYLLVITGVAVVARLSFNSLIAGMLPCAWLGWLIGDQTAYLRELARLPPDHDGPTRTSAPIWYGRLLATWAYRLAPFVLFGYIMALALYVVWATPSPALTDDAAQAQANRGFIVLVFAELVIAVGMSAYFAVWLRTITQRQFLPDSTLSRQINAAFRRYVADQRRLMLLATLIFGWSALNELTEPGILLILAPLLPFGLALWLSSTHRLAVVVAKSRRPDGRMW